MTPDEVGRSAHDRVRDALTEHLHAAGIDGALVSGFVLLGEFIDGQGRENWLAVMPVEQSVTTSLGQTDMLRTYLHACLARSARGRAE